MYLIFSIYLSDKSNRVGYHNRKKVANINILNFVELFPTFVPGEKYSGKIAFVYRTGENKVLSQQAFVFMKTSLVFFFRRRLQDVFKTS